MSNQEKEPHKKFSLRARGESLGYAFEGLLSFFKKEHNALIHLAATVVVVALCFVFPVSTVEIMLLAFAVGLVWMAELFNTAIEKIMDFVSSEKLPAVKFIKDIAAAAVFIAAVTALVIGCLVFIPKIF